MNADSKAQTEFKEYEVKVETVFPMGQAGQFQFRTGLARE
jgi:hypothetical protein